MVNVVPFVFQLGGLTVLPFWVLMVAFPGARLTARLLRSPLAVAGPALLYAVLVVPLLATLLPAVACPALPGIAALLGTPLGATIAWMHFLALDLLAGRWLFLEARARGLGAAVTSPLLVLTLLFAPLGLLAALAVFSRPGGAVLGWAGSARRRLVVAHRPLALLTAGSAALLAATLILGLLDHRQVGGAPVWLKPGKFAAAVGTAAAALAWIIGQMRGPAERRLRFAGTAMAAFTALELVLITMQAARGVGSHFNFATRFDGAVFTVMGIAISLFWLAELYVAVRAFRQPFATPARTWAIRLGLVGALLGGATGYRMAQPTREQLASFESGRPAAVVGGHAVGVADGGPGLPVTRWSTTGGDLRVPHFLGLHALQVLPLLAFYAERRRRGRARLVWAGAIVWVGLGLVTFVQALRGQPLLAPDAITAASALAVVAAGAFAVTWGRAPVGAPARAAAA